VLAKAARAVSNHPVLPEPLGKAKKREKWKERGT